MIYFIYVCDGLVAFVLFTYLLLNSYYLQECSIIIYMTKTKNAANAGNLLHIS